MKKLTTLSIALLFSSPAVLSAESLTLDYQLAWSTQHGNSQSASGNAEIISRDAQGHLWVIGPDGIDILNQEGALIAAIDTRTYGNANSIAIKDGKAAVAFAASTKTDPGQVVFFDATNRKVLEQVQVGANPDMVKFTAGGQLLVANEGEAKGGIDPDGSINIIQPDYKVEKISFSNYNGQENTLREKGVRIAPDTAAAADFEPEYIAVSADGSTAYVTLQENNSLAIVNIENNSVEQVVSFGVKDHSVAGNGLDASDKDSSSSIKNWPVYGMYMPDAIDAYQANGSTYLITANEGDARDEDERVKKLKLNPSIFPNATTLQQDENLGRLKVSTIDGDADGDGQYEALYSYGGRSFSIWDEEGGLVWDSGDFIETLLSEDYPELWAEKRSDNKGSEPEGIALLSFGNNTLAFIGLERSNAILAFDITNPASPNYLNLLYTDGDSGPEGLLAYDYNGSYWLAVANEKSKSTTLYQLDVQSVPEPASMALFAMGFLCFFSFFRLKGRK